MNVAARLIIAGIALILAIGEPWAHAHETDLAHCVTNYYSYKERQVRRQRRIATGLQVARNLSIGAAGVTGAVVGGAIGGAIAWRSPKVLSAIPANAPPISPMAEEIARIGLAIAGSGFVGSASVFLGIGIPIIMASRFGAEEHIAAQLEKWTSGPEPMSPDHCEAIAIDQMLKETLPPSSVSQSIDPSRPTSNTAQ